MSWLRRAWDRDLAWSFRHSPVALAAAVLTALCVGGALFAPWPVGRSLYPCAF